MRRRSVRLVETAVANTIMADDDADVFFQKFRRVLRLIGITSTQMLRDHKDWQEHTLPMQTAAKWDRAHNPKVIARLGRQGPQHGRPLTIFPLWDEIEVPEQLLPPMPLSTRPPLTVQQKWFLVREKRSDGDIMSHFLKAPRSTRETIDEFKRVLMFHPLVVVLGGQLLQRLYRAFDLYEHEREVADQLHTQFANRLHKAKLSMRQPEQQSTTPVVRRTGVKRSKRLQRPATRALLWSVLPTRSNVLALHQVKGVTDNVDVFARVATDDTAQAVAIF